MRVILPLMAASFASGTQSFVFGGLLAELAADLGVTLGVAGQLATVYAATVALGAPLAAMLVARLERRMVLVAALGLMAVFNILAMLTAGYAELLGLRVLAALGSAFLGPISTAAAMALVPPGARGRAFAMVTGGVTLALVLGIPLGSLVGAWLGWRATFGFAALLIVLAAAWVRLGLPRIPPPATAPQPLGDALRIPAVVTSLAMTFLGFTAIFTVASYIGPIVTRATGLSAAGVGPFQACVGIGAILGVLLGGRLADRHGGWRTFAAVFAVMATTLLAYAPLLGLPAGWIPPGTTVAAPLLALIVLVGAGALFTLIPLAQVRLARAAPTAGPVLFGLNGSMIFAGQGAGALLGGLGIELAGFGAIALGGTATALLALLMVLLAVRRQG